MKKIAAQLVGFLFILSSLLPATASADNIFKGARKRHQKMHREVQEVAREVRETLVPPLVYVDRGPRYHDDVIYYPRGSYKRYRDRCSVVLDLNHRPYCRTHHHYGDWRYGTLGLQYSRVYPGLHWIVWYNGGWWCDRCGSRSCSYLAGNPYYRTARYEEYALTERAHDLWDSGEYGAGANYGAWQLHTPPPADPHIEGQVYSPVLERHFGAIEGFTREGKPLYCNELNSRACVIVIGPVDSGKSFNYVGTRKGPDGKFHSAYCAWGERCE